MTTGPVDDAIQLLLSNDESTANEIVRSIIENTGWFDEACNVLSVGVARRLVAGTLEYSEADDIMNWVWSYMLHDNADVPQPAFRIYEAVDAGEYRHPGDSEQIDPVKKYTLPWLREILQGESSDDDG